MMVNRLILTTLVALLSAGIANASLSFQKGIKKQAIVIPDTKKIVSIRGGAGPIEPATAAKLVGALCAVQGAISTLSPTTNSKAYGLKDDYSPLNVKINREIGLTVLQTGIIAFCLFFKGTSVNTAIGVGSLLWSAESLKALLDNDSETVGPSKVGSLSILAFAGTAAYAGLTNADWALTAFKADAIYTLIAGIPLLFNAAFGIKLWELKDTNEITPGLVIALGCNIIVTGTLKAAIAWGIDPIKAFGYTTLAGFVTSFKCNFFSPDFDVLGLDLAPLMFWMVVNAVLSTSILL